MRIEGEERKQQGKMRTIFEFFGSQEFWSDRRGVTWIYVTITASALFGFAALVIDFSRVEITHTQARAAAEAVALTGASQLDGTSDAITRSLNAAYNTPIVQNDQNLGATAGNITITKIRFLSGLPAGDPTLPEDPSVLDPYVVADQTWTAASAPDAPFEARFIEVTTQQITVNNSFIQVVGGGPNAVTDATAVAGFTQVLCKRAPLAICNPTENPPPPGGTGAYGNKAPPFKLSDWKGREILLKGAKANADWVPGDFSLVDIDGTQSTPAIWDALAAAEPDVCINARIDLKPGQVNGARTALNTRFGSYSGPQGNGKGSQTKYRPAKNVTKGKSLDASCALTDPDPSLVTSMALPNDNGATNYVGNSNPSGGISNDYRFGDGNWNCETYWTTMHPDAPVGAGPPPNCADNSNAVSRYDAYQYEINNEIPNPSNDPTVNPPYEDGGGLGANSCYSGDSDAVNNDILDRRIVYFAVINCIELGPIHGNSSGPLPVEAFVKGFLTRPVEEPSSESGVQIYMEVVDIARPGDGDGVLHDIVQLYR